MANLSGLIVPWLVMFFETEYGDWVLIYPFTALLCGLICILYFAVASDIAILEQEIQFENRDAKKKS